MPEQVVYRSDHGVPVALYAEDRGSYTAHRLQFGDGGGGVVIIARRADRICLVHHHRPAVDEAMWEFPRGLIDRGESAAEAAKREFSEETGHELYQTTVFGTYYGDTAIYPAQATVVYGPASASAVESRDGEVDEVGWFSLSTIRRMVADGEIRDGHTLSALAHYFVR